MTKYQTNDWSITDLQVNYLLKLLNIYKPCSICEFGAGVSTQIFEDYIEENTNAKLLTIEHNSEYQYKHTKLFDLKEFGHISIGDLSFDNTHYYDGLESFFYETNQNENYKFDFVFIDGPFGFNCDNSRCQLLDFIYFDLIADSCIFIIHDSERENNKNIQQIFEQQLTNRSYKFTILEDNELKQMKTYFISRNIKGED